MADVKKAMDAFRKKGYEASYFETKEEAVDYLKQTISRTTVAFGGSMTLAEMGLFDALKETNLVCANSYYKSKDLPQVTKHCKIFISSANAITETGEIINIDGTGNRVASTIFGHEKVYFIVGVNKLTPDLESGLYRAKNVAGPMNARRLNKKTPCAAKADKCYDCDCPDRICAATCIMDRKLAGSAYEIVFINQSLGY